MAIKSKSKASNWPSIIALTIGLLSLMYCYSFIQQLIGQEFFHSDRTIMQLTRILKGGA